MDSKTWDEEISRLPDAHLLQSWEWGQVKGATGWEPIYQEWRGAMGELQAAALVLKRTAVIGGVAMPIRVLYVPRGPLLDWSDAPLRQRVLDDLQALASKQGAIFIKMDPGMVLGTGVPGSEGAQENSLAMQVIEEWHTRGWLFSNEQIQFRNTAVLDLEGTEEDWLARMKQKARYNLRLSQKKGVSVRTGSLTDLPLLYKMYAETSVRDGFVIRSESYYRTVWSTFIERGMARPLIAEVEGEPVAALLIFFFAGRAYYLFGMSRDLHRDTMPNYLLQWEAMRTAKVEGCRIYDLWGAPDEFNEEDSMWGVFRFKEGLGAQVVRTPGAWDYPANQLMYTLYTRTLPRILDVMRRRGKEQTRQAVGV